MANVLSAEPLSILQSGRVRDMIEKTAVLTLPSTSTVDIAPYVLSYGEITIEAMGISPSDIGKIVFTLTSLECKNADGFFDIGNGSVWDNSDEPDGTVLEIEGTLLGETAFWWKGYLDQPDYDHDSGLVTLSGRHVLADARDRVWTRADRIGGYSGFKYNFT